jgi:acetylglutamate kinase
MSRFSKHREKPKWKPKEGSLVVINANGVLVEVGEIKEVSGERLVQLSVDGVTGSSWVKVTTVIESIRNGMWRVVKDGPIEPEKILKEFKFI